MSVKRQAHANLYLKLFYRNFDNFLRLKMTKMQLFDESHLIINFQSEEGFFKYRQTADEKDLYLPSFFVIYNMITTEILNIYENNSSELFGIFKRFRDHFRNASLHSPTQFSFYNYFKRDMHNKIFETITNDEGQTHAIKHALYALPYSCQSYSVSPYFDLTLFNYDDKLVSPTKRMEKCSYPIIRFIARDSGLLRFEMYTGFSERIHRPSVRRFVDFVFHPFDPFAISIEFIKNVHVTNIHVRHSLEGCFQNIHQSKQYLS